MSYHLKMHSFWMTRIIKADNIKSQRLEASRTLIYSLMGWKKRWTVFLKVKQTPTLKPSKRIENMPKTGLVQEC